MQLFKHSWQVIAAYEAKETELMGENVELRSLLSTLKDELRKLTEQYNQAVKWIKTA